MMDSQRKMSRMMLVWCAVAAAGGLVVSYPAGCGEEQHRRKLEASTKPAAETPAPAAPTATPAAVAETPACPGPLQLPGAERRPIGEGWLTIEEQADIAQRAWVEGSVQGDDKLVLTTSNVNRFKLDLSRVRLNWDERIVLRLDGFNSELTRKRWPVLHLSRTPSGAWVVADE